MTTPPPPAFRTIGDFDLLESIGAGGMGVVYRARDRRLGRDVAIKLLPDGVASDPARLARFQREAKLLATLSHPHIGAIHGLIESEGTSALVLELIEGETLAARVARGPLRVAEALAIAIQILDALDHVHQRGIIHRDLKPSNVMLTKSGVKLLDFGVGKFTPGAEYAAGVEGAATDTATGQVVGTLHYMAPEQLEGREAGPRSDLFAVGALFHEMLTGRKAFDGGSAAAVVGAILGTTPPPLSSRSHDAVPPRLDRVIAKCLEKDPERRWQSARDLSDALGWIRDESSSVAAPLPMRARPLWPIAAGVALVAGIGIAAVGWPWRASSRATSGGATPIRFTVTAPADHRMLAGGFAVSFDGTQVIFRGVRNTQGQQLFVRRLDQFDAIALTNGPGNEPSISPDGEEVAFLSKGGIYRMSLRGDRSPILLAEVGPVAFDVNWSQPDAILFNGRDQPIRRISPSGGAITALTTIDTAAEIDHHTGSILPGGRALVFAIHRPRNRFDVAVQRLDTGARRVLIQGAHSPTYSSTGHLLFMRTRHLLAVPFDLDRLEITGPEVTLVQDIDGDESSGQMDYRFSPSGVLAYQPRRVPDLHTFVWVDRNGKETPLPLQPGRYEAPRISPDGRSIAFGTTDPWRVWTYDLVTERLTPISTDAISWGPLWAPNGTTLFYAVDRPEASHVLRHPFGAEPESIGQSINDLWPTGFAADGSLIVVEDPPTNNYRIGRLTPGRGNTPQNFADRPGLPNLARPSPDGQWVAFNSRVVDNTLQVYVQSATGRGAPRQVTVDGGQEPVWRRDGRELYYRRGDAMFAVAIHPGASLSWGKPVLLFKGNYVALGADFDVAPDGRFLMLKLQPGVPPVVRLNVVVDWAKELIARVKPSP